MNKGPVNIRQACCTQICLRKFDTWKSIIRETRFCEYENISLEISFLLDEGSILFDI